MSEYASQPLPVPDSGNDHSAETSSGRHKSAKWEIVARTSGLIPAQIIAGRLRSEGIPVRAWQEAAGQAIGLTVGILGTGYVAVPQEFLSRAEAILDENETDQTEAFDDLNNKSERS